MIDSRRPPEEADEIFADALELETRDRAAFVAERCRDRTRLRAEVESLLRAHEASGDFLGKPVDMDQGLVGQRIGAFAIDSVIARGGMGTVYSAHRCDSMYEQRVAVKVIRSPWISDGIRARFERERQTLASLEHPAITRLIDGGTTPSGLPYLVMEYVDGERLDDFRKRAEPSIEERLELFCRVCDAVQFAHQKLVVHRDLKPGNILVSKDGAPKLLDFGIAKILHPEETGSRDRLTTEATGRETHGTETLGTSVGALTPLYASPEQVRGRAATTASDVYSLGVILFELLTGRRPYDFDRVLGYEQARAICEDAVPLASQCVPDAPGLGRRLRGDLDGILLRALEKVPERRYGTARELADDVRRHLAGEPVSARRATVFYRASKFVRRNPTLVVAATLFVLLLVGGSAGSFLAFIRIRDAERAERGERAVAEAARLTAERAQSEAEDVRLFLEDLLAEANGYRYGRGATVLDLLDDAAHRARTELVARPAVEAGVSLSLAKAHGGMWNWSTAVPLLRRALELYRELPGDRRAEIAETLSILGRGLCFVDDEALPPEPGDEWEAIGLQREALALRTELFGPAHHLIAESKTNLAYAMWGGPRYRYAEADALYREGIDLFRRVGSDVHVDFARALMSHAIMLSRLGRSEEALPLLEESVGIYRQSKDRADLYAVHTLQTYGNFMMESGRYDEAEELLEECALLTPEFARMRVLRIDLQYSEIERQRGNLSEARAHLLRALTILCEVDADKYTNDAATFREIGRRFAAGELERPARQLLGAHFRNRGSDLPSVAGALIDVGEQLSAESHLDAAARVLADCHRILIARRPPEHPDRRRLAVALDRVRDARARSRSETRTAPADPEPSEED